MKVMDTLVKKAEAGDILTHSIRVYIFLLKPEPWLGSPVPDRQVDPLLTQDQVLGW